MVNSCLTKQTPHTTESYRNHYLDTVTSMFEIAQECSFYLDYFAHFIQCVNIVLNTRKYYIRKLHGYSNTENHILEHILTET